MSYNKQDLLINKTSRLGFTPTGSYENSVKRRLDRRMFSTYKIYDPKMNGIDLAGSPTYRYVQYGYWEDPYTVVYNKFNPPPPIDP
jgi:hypothetical protein